MTTIAYDGKTLAADSLACCSFKVQQPFNKIHDTGSHLVALAGNYSVSLEWVEWFKSGFEGEKDFKDGLQGAFVVDKSTGFLTVYPQEGKYPSEQPSNYPNAIGSGEQFAMGAMLAGATAIEAIKIAQRLDKGTGDLGDVYVVCPELKAVEGI